MTREEKSKYRIALDFGGRVYGGEGYACGKVECVGVVCKVDVMPLWLEERSSFCFVVGGSWCALCSYWYWLWWSIIGQID